MTPTLLHSLLFLASSLTLTTSLPTAPSTCTVPPPNGYELVDDSPLINTALSTCGPSGGTIIVPYNATPYSIRSQIDFSPCVDCDFQLEAQFLVSRDEWTYWNDIHSIIKVANVSGARIRSLTGKGGIDGNAVDYYWRDRYANGYGEGINDGPHFMHITNSSSNIQVSDLSVWNVPLRFFRIDGGSHDLDFRNLNLTVRDQWNVFGNPAEESESFGFELADATNVTISDTTMDFRLAKTVRGGEPGDGVGGCVILDRGTKDILVQNINCAKAIAGVMVMIGTSDFGGIQLYMTRDIPKGHDVQNVLFRNITYGSGIGGWATGWKNSIEFANETMRNVTWDGVTVQSQQAVVADDCYQRCHCTSFNYPTCQKKNWIPAFEDIRFKNYKGAVGTVPADGLGCVANQTKCDITFENWGTS